MLETLAEPSTLEAVAMVLATASRALAANPVAAAVVGGVATILSAVAVAKRKKKVAEKTEK